MVRRQVLLLLASILGSFQRLFAGLLTPSVQKVVPTRAWQREGLVTMSTSSDGLWTYVTMPPSAGKNALDAALVVQYPRSSPCSPIEFEGRAVLEYRSAGEEKLPSVLALGVKPESRRGWFFRLPQFGGDTPAGLAVVEPIAGIAIYMWDAHDRAAPSSHRQFVKKLKDDVAETMKRS